LSGARAILDAVAPDKAAQIDFGERGADRGQASLRRANLQTVPGLD
jgi:hypothetical protein